MLKELLFAACLLQSQADSWPPEVEAALSKAGENRAALEGVLNHFRSGEDARKYEAACFLVANMEGHGYTVYGLFDEQGNEVPFDALDHASFGEAQAALDALEKEHGTLDFKGKDTTSDLETVPADLLIENIEQAFEAWRTLPWAAELTFDAFREHVLPYRGSNEPLEAWRAACRERYADLAERMKDPKDPLEAGRLISGDVGGWVGFDSLYYLHPTDQGFGEMCERRKGRCEDITNMTTFALRSNAVASAADYTPWWADRDNNHAWTVILDAKGEGRAGLGSRAAKIYRKTFSHQLQNLAFQLGPEEEAPRWLGRKNYCDVTSQYLETSDLRVRLRNEAPEGAQHAYLAVFNGGEWKAIHWGRIEGGEGREVTFTDMGRGIAYLPAFFDGEELLPAAPPFFLAADGAVQTLGPRPGSRMAIELPAAGPSRREVAADGGLVSRLKPGVTYELFVWKDGWTSLGRQEAGAGAPVFRDVPVGGLYWLVADGSRRLERIFALRGVEQVWM